VLTALALILLAGVLAVGLGTRMRHLRGLACAGAAVLVFWGPPGLVALATALTLRRWAGEP
jgi:hypothetical protein